MVCLASRFFTVTILLASSLFATPLFGAKPAQISSVEEFSPATRVTGSPVERGRMYGVEFKDRIRDFLDQEIYATFIGKPSTKEDLLRYAAACGKVTRELCPMIAAEIDGIAAGAGLSFDEIILIQLHEELYHRSKLPYEGHCTAVAVAPSDSGDGHAYVGQTWDWMTSVAGKSSVVEWQRDDAPSLLAYGFPGMPIGAGVNSQGIALCWTSAALKRSGKDSPRIGLPSYVLLTHLLSQNTLDDVIREANRDRHAGWFTFVMADANGGLLNVEGSPEGVVVERHQQHLVRGDYGTRQMTKVDESATIPLAVRCVKFYELLSATSRHNNLETLQRYLTERDHQIAIWENPKNPRNKTIDVMIFDTTSRKAYLSRGPSYGLRWQEFSLTNSN